ncbi:MAG: MFS transporter [Chloroflexi bacterium]|nr:MFS transporter [Chloroflexota bacterium]
MATTEGTPNGGWARPFFTLWSAQQLSLVGSAVAGFGLIWWVTRETGSALALTGSALVAMLPGLVLGPFVGALVDRWSRRVVMVVADGVVALFSAWLVYLMWADVLQMWHVYLILFVRGLGGAFHWPAVSSSISLMVPEKHLARVQGLDHTMMGLRNIASPSVGALLVALLPLHWVMAVDVVTAVLAIVLVMATPIPRPQRQGEAKTTVLRDVLEGIFFIRRWPGVAVLMTLAVVANFIAWPLNSLLPLLVTKHFGRGALELGWLQSAWGIGMLAGGLTLSAWGGFKRQMLTSLIGLMGLGVGVVFVGFSPATMLWLALLGQGIFGFCNPICNGPIYAILQAKVPNYMQGRVFTLVGSLCSAAAPLGLLVAGGVSEIAGPRLWFQVGGWVFILGALTSLMIPSVFYLEDAVLTQGNLEQRAPTEEETSLDASTTPSA